MSIQTNPFSVFTKPWHTPLPELAAFVKSLGFDGIELPVRPGYQVPPENVSRGLPEAVKILGDLGLKIYSVAGPTDEATIAACAEQGIPIIRIMADVGDGGYITASKGLSLIAISYCEGINQFLIFNFTDFHRLIHRDIYADFHKQSHDYRSFCTGLFHYNLCKPHMRKSCTNHHMYNNLQGIVSSMPIYLLKDSTRLYSNKYIQ